MKTKTHAGRPVGTCCCCWSQDTTRSNYGTYYCATHRAEVIAWLRGRR